ncbi:MAG TPA: hypothetical protein VK885_09340 [Desulfotignum sp.]|nr:hypothetical protein [Desulfotignum sp.]
MVALTATSIRRDGHQPLIFMQCEPIRHSVSRPETAPAQWEVWPKVLSSPEIPPDRHHLNVNKTHKDRFIAVPVRRNPHHILKIKTRHPGFKFRVDGFYFSIVYKGIALVLKQPVRKST